MSVDVVTGIVDYAIRVILVVSLPSVTVGMVVGLLIAIIQAVTQVQEQTLTFVPKMVVVLLIIAATFPWMVRVIVEMTVFLWRNIPVYAN